MNAKNTDSYAFQFFILLCLVVFAWVVRVGSLQMIEGLGDAFHKWHFAKQVLAGAETTNWNHHKTRFAINAPLIASQWILGTRPMFYYVLPLFFALLQVFFVFKITQKLAGTWQATLASVLLILCPQMIRTGSQVLPGVFEGAYMVGAAYCIVCFYQSPKKMMWISACAVLCFLGYLTKITNLFFLPGIVLAIGLKRDQWRYSLVFLSILFGFYLLETCAYALFTDYTFGRLQVITGSYMVSGKIYKTTFFGLFDRYLNASWYIKYPIIAFFLASPFFLYRTKHASRVIFLMGLSFLFCITFYIKSVNPMSLGIVFRQRYLAVLVPFLAIGIALILNRGLPFPIPQKRKVPAAIISVAALAALLSGHLRFRQNPVFVIPKIESVLNRSVENHIPITTNVSKNRKLVRNLMLVQKIFLNNDNADSTRIYYGYVESQKFAYLAESKVDLASICTVEVVQSGTVKKEGYSIALADVGQADNCLSLAR